MCLSACISGSILNCLSSYKICIKMTKREERGSQGEEFPLDYLVTKI